MSIPLAIGIAIIVLVVAAAIVVWSRRVISDPKHYAELLAKAERARDSNRPQEVRRALQRVIRGTDRVQAPSEEVRGLGARAYLWLGNLDFESGDVEKSLVSYRRAAQGTDVGQRVLKLVADSYAAARDVSPEALDTYVRYLQGQASAESGAADDAVLSFVRQCCALDLAPEGAPNVDVAKRMVPFAQRLVALDATFEWAHRAIGVGEIELGHYDAGIAALEEAERLDPGQAILPYLLAVALQRADRPPAPVEAALRRTVGLDADQPEALLLLALILAPEAEDAHPTSAALTEASDFLQHACRLRETGLTWYHLGRVQASLDDTAGARASLERGLALLPQHAEGWWRLATVLIQRQDRRAAIDALRQVISLRPADVRARFTLAQQARGEGLLGEAETQYRAVLQREPDHVGADVGLGRSLYGQARWAEAIAVLQPRIAVLPPEARFELGRAYDQAERPAQAALTYEDLLDNGGREPETLFRLGCARARMEQFLDAVSAFQEAEALQAGIAGRPELPRYRGLALLRLNRFEEASSAFDLSLAIDAQSAETNYHRGVAALRMGRWAVARAAFERTVAIDERHAPAWYGIGIVREHVDPRDALTAYRKAHELDPEWEACRGRLGVALAKAGEWATSVPTLQSMTSQSDGADEWRRYLGMGLARAGRHADALAAWRTLDGAADTEWLTSNRAEAHYHVGQTAFAAGAHRDAVRSLKEAYELRPDVDKIRLALAEAYVADGLDMLASADTALAASDAFVDCLRVSPDDARARFFLGVLALASGDVAEAIRRLEALVKSADDSRARYYLALAHLTRGTARDADTAVGELQQLLQREAQFGPRLRLDLAEAQINRGRWAEAFEAYEMLLRQLSPHEDAPIQQDGVAERPAMQSESLLLETR